MCLVMSLFKLIIVLCAGVSQIAAHGYLEMPVSRNLYAQQQGAFWDVMSGNGLGLGNIGGPGAAWRCHAALLQAQHTRSKLRSCCSKFCAVVGQGLFRAFLFLQQALRMRAL